MKKFLCDNIRIFGIFIVVVLTAYYYGQIRSHNGLPICTDDSIKNTFTNLVKSDVGSTGFRGAPPVVEKFRSDGYSDNANYCLAKVTLVLGGTADTFDVSFKVYRNSPDANGYKVGFFKREVQNEKVN